MRILMSANGPRFSLYKEDLAELYSKGYLDAVNKDENLRGRLKLEDSEPNQRFHPNGYEYFIDPDCEKGMLINHLPLGVGQHERNVLHFWALHISKEKFQKILDSSDEYGECGDFSRCKYDRFSLSILTKL